MFDKYLEKILPIPIVDIEVSKTDGYKYRVTTYSSIINEYGTEKRVASRLEKNKRIKSFDGWYMKDKEPFFKQMIVEFKKPFKNKWQLV